MTTTNHNMRDLIDRCKRAAEVLITDGTRAKYPNGVDALRAPAITPPLPRTRADATPSILLGGPFKDDASLVAVGIFVGIGFVDVHAIGGSNRACEVFAISGDGMEARGEFLKAAVKLFWDHLHFVPEASA